MASVRPAKSVKASMPVGPGTLDVNERGRDHYKKRVIRERNSIPEVDISPATLQGRHRTTYLQKRPLYRRYHRCQRPPTQSGQRTNLVQRFVGPSWGEPNLHYPTVKKELLKTLPPKRGRLKILLTRPLPDLLQILLQKV